MSEQKHTPEPWYNDGKVIVGSTPKYGRIGGAHDPEDAIRIVSCVNALAGKENPEKWVKKAEKALEDKEKHEEQMKAAKELLKVSVRTSLCECDDPKNLCSLCAAITRAEAAFGGGK